VWAPAIRCECTNCSLKVPRERRLKGVNERPTAIHVQSPLYLGAWCISDSDCGCKRPRTVLLHLVSSPAAPAYFTLCTHKHLQLLEVAPLTNCVATGHGSSFSLLYFIPHTTTLGGVGGGLSFRAPILVWLTWICTCVLRTRDFIFPKWKTRRFQTAFWLVIRSGDVQHCPI
jgi:hypothetical protein